MDSAGIATGVTRLAPENYLLAGPALDDKTSSMRGKVTNLEIQKWVVRQHSFVPEAAWIEACKREWGLAPAEGCAAVPCPAEKKVILRQAFRALGLLGHEGVERS